MPGYPRPVDRRHKPFEKKMCVRCDEKEFRIKGFCSVYCKDTHYDEVEIVELKDTLRSTLGAIDAMVPIVDKFFSSIGQDLHEELPGLRSIISDSRAKLGD